MKNDKKSNINETADNGHSDLLKQVAEENKMFLTDAERTLWNILRSKSIGYKFRQQHVIGDYIADFVNLHCKLIVEVDGKYHFKGEQPVADALRTKELNNMGYTVVRFTNEEVLHHSGLVVNQLRDIIKRMEISYPKASSNLSERRGEDNDDVVTSSPLLSPSLSGGSGWTLNAWAVDAACSGNPGPMEYRGIDLQTRAQVFHFGPCHGTNNIGEFLAIVHALALLYKQGDTQKTIYSDSYNAILWVKKKQCKTKLVRTPQTEELFQVIERGEQWLRTHAYKNPVVKWETKKWGEVPADFGRKK